MSIYPNILVTNDDGIYSPGIFALWSAMKELGTVTVVAPDTEKSAVGKVYNFARNYFCVKTKFTDNM